MLLSEPPEVTFPTPIPHIGRALLALLLYDDDYDYYCYDYDFGYDYDNWIAQKQEIVDGKQDATKVLKTSPSSEKSP